jgi:hypothetical protein
MSVARHATQAVLCATLTEGSWDYAEACHTDVLNTVVATARRKEASRIRRDENLAHLTLIRCIFGNPYRPVQVAPSALNRTVQSLATAAYEERTLPSGKLDRDRLLVLADALEDGGCADAAVLEHLRSPGPHVRGCWALDTLLGKA